MINTDNLYQRKIIPVYVESIECLQQIMFTKSIFIVTFQLQAALLDIHEIFFDTPVIEQMGLIEQTRLNTREKRLKSVSDASLIGRFCPRDEIKL